MDRYRHVFAVLAGMLIGMAAPVVCAVILSKMHPEINMRDHAFTIMVVSLIFGAVGVAMNLPNSTATGESAYYGAMGSDGGRRKRSGRPTHKAERRDASAHEQAAPTGEDEAGSARPSEDESAGRHIPHRATKIPLGRREALFILGLELTATNEQIRGAFRRLAKENHPDQFTRDGDQAVAEATLKFRKIHEAYKSLLG